MANGNPFYVQPGGNFLPGLSMLSDTVSDLGKQRKAENMKLKFENIKKGAVEAYRSGDPDVIAEYSLQNPELAQALSLMSQHRNKRTEDDYIDSAFQILTNPDQADMIVRSRQKMLQDEGATAQTSLETDGFIEQLNLDREGTLKNLEAEMAFRSPDKYKAWKGAMATEKPTEDIRNYEYYRTLQRENPAEADRFATQTGIKKDDRTTAIKEFEYADKHPKYANKLKKDADDKKTNEVKKQAFADSTKLRKEFLEQSKDYQKVRDSYTRVINSTEDPSPAGDLALIFNYMKMLDPGSVVRESEFRTAATAGSYGQRIQASVQKVISGERLAPNMRADFVKKSAELLKGMEEQHSKRIKEYTNIATKNSLPVDEVVVDITAPEQEITPEDKPTYKEGQTATGPNGEKIIFRNGVWENM